MEPIRDMTMQWSKQGLEKFLRELQNRVNDPDAKGRRLLAARQVLDRFQVIKCDGHWELDVLNWKKSGKDHDSQAISAINDSHLDMEFTLPGGPKIQIVRLERVHQNTDGQKHWHHFLPVTHSSDMRATVCPADDYARLMELINQLPTVKQAVLIQHSGDSAKSIVSRLLRKGADVQLFVQAADSAQPPFHKNRLASLYEDIPNRYLHDGGSLRVYYYPSPASLRAVLVDDQVLAIGWYNYFSKENRQFILYGHNQPYLHLKKGQGAFQALRDMMLNVTRSIEKHAQPAIVLPRNRIR
ncbi:MAG: hypothetical protein IT446_01625 [Phycisphaerales bacterium]|nr:hypothetical protein [Phycisphaerales bacterium]